MYLVILAMSLLPGLTLRCETLLGAKDILAKLTYPLPTIGYVAIATSNAFAAFVNFKGIPRLMWLLNADHAVPFFRYIFYTHHISHSTLLSSQSAHHHAYSSHNLGTSSLNSPAPTPHSIRSHNTSPHFLRSVLLTTLVTALPCLVGNYSLLAPLVSVPVLLVYVAVNISCFLLAFIKTPKFRPHWQYFRWVVVWKDYCVHFSHRCQLILLVLSCIAI